jgi:hypothetical protein
LIIGRRDGKLLMVTQVAHGRISGQLASVWGNEQFDVPEPFDAVCIAAKLHDEGWEEPDASPFYNDRTRRPADFLEIDLREHSRFYERGVKKVFAEDPYSGLLAAMHWTGLYCGRWGSAFGMVRRDLDEDLQAFLNGVVRDQELSWVDAKSALWDPSTPRSAFEQRVWMNYDLLQSLDILSLLCCLADTERAMPENVLGAVPSSFVGERGSLRLRRIDGQTLAVSPWPFSGPEVEVPVPGTVIPDRDYRSTEDVLEQLFGSEDVRLTVRLIPGSD